MSVAFSLEVGSAVYKADEISSHLMLKDFELHVLGHPEPLKVLSKNLT